MSDMVRVTNQKWQVQSQKLKVSHKAGVTSQEWQVKKWQVKRDNWRDKSRSNSQEAQFNIEKSWVTRQEWQIKSN